MIIIKEKMKNKIIKSYDAPLDFAYVISVWIGFWSSAVLFSDLITHRPFEISSVLHILLTLTLFVCGAIGVVHHSSGYIFKEYTIIVPVIVGLVSVLAIYVVDAFESILENVDLAATTGIAGGIITTLIIYLIKRFLSIGLLLKESKKNQKVIEKIESLEA